MARIDPSHIVGITAEITISYLGGNAVAPSDLPALVKALREMVEILCTAHLHPGAETRGRVMNSKHPRPAVPISKSITEDFIISLEDGRKMRSMKKYLTKLGMTPDNYRSKWGLPQDYPMIAPSYAKVRSKIAKAGGLGRKPSADWRPTQRSNA